MAQFPGLTLWTDAWIADTKHLTRLERGTYLDLLVLMWRTPGCSVPNDDEWLAKRLGMMPDEVAGQLRPLISEFCQNDGNRIRQKRLKREHERAQKHSTHQSDRAKSRWKKKKSSTQAYATNTTVAYAGNTTAASPSKSVPDKPLSDNKKNDATYTLTNIRDIEANASISPDSKRRRRSKREKTSLPDGFHSELIGQEEFERFCDHARANARLCADWEAAWRNWQRSPYRKRGQNGQGQSKPKDDPHSIKAALARQAAWFNEGDDEVGKLPRELDLRVIPGRSGGRS